MKNKDSHEVEVCLLQEIFTVHLSVLIITVTIRVGSIQTITYDSKIEACSIFSVRKKKH